MTITLSSRLVVVTLDAYKICPVVEPDDTPADTVPEVLDTSLTPDALKKISRSVMDISSLSEMREISKSTSNLMTGGITGIAKLGKMQKKKKEKSISKTTLISESYESLDLESIDVKASAVFSTASPACGFLKDGGGFFHC